MFRSRSRWIIRKPLRARERGEALFLQRGRASGTHALTWLVLAIACRVAEAHAQDDRELRLDWQVPSECPDREWALARVSERLGRPLAGRSSDVLTAEATVTREGESFVLALHTEQGESRGDRAMSALSCPELVEAAVLVLALAIDAEAVARTEQGEPANAAAPPAKVDVVDSERPPGLASETVAPEPVERPADYAWALRADALWPYGLTPGITAGPSLAVAYALQRLRAELSGYWLVPRTGSDESSVGRVRVSLWALRPTVCAAIVGQRTQLSACAAFELGRIGGRGLGLPVREQNYALWAAASLGPRLAIALGKHAALVLDAAPILPVYRPRFVSTNAQGQAQTRLYEASALAFRATLGLELRF
jgi:hypothetical protein